MEGLHPLEAAMVACRRAVDARGLKIMLVNVHDVDDVRAKLLYHAASLQVGTIHLDEDLQTHDKLAEANTAHNVALLAELLSQWLKHQGSPDA
jgi:hypothetical protein